MEGTAMTRIDATVEAVAIQILFFLLSIVGAWLVLRILKGTAQIKNKGAQFGGAAAMFVAMFFLLNRYTPEMRDGILTEAHAAQTITTKKDGGASENLDVYISPVQQKVTPRELQQLDKNKFIVNPDLGIAVLRPTEAGWSAEVVNSVDSVGIVDLPVMKLSLGAFKAMADGGIKSNPVFALRESKVHSLLLKADSEVRGIRMDMNPFADDAFVRKTVEAQMEMTRSIATGELAAALNDPEKRVKVVDEMMATIGPQLKDGFANMLAKTIPTEKHIQNGVYVTAFDIVDVSGGVVVQLSKGMTPLDRAIESLAFQGVQMGNGRNLKIDQNQGVVSFDATQRLNKVVVDGSTTDVTLNNLGFLVAAEKRIVFVQLLFLDLGEGLSTSLFLKKVMDSLLFTT
jgi:hypothetical protein